MIALYIVAAVLGILFAVAMLPVSLSLKYKDELSLTLSAFGILLWSYPKPKKKVKISDYSIEAVKKRRKKAQRERNSKKGKTHTQKSAQASQKKEKTLLGTLEVIKDLLTALIPDVWGKLKIKTTKIIITVATDDAAKTALLFPAVNTAVLGIVTYLDNNDKLSGLKKSDISVSADFASEKPTADIDISFSLRTWQAAKTLFVTALKYSKHKISE